ncbi:probable lysine-specific demethylase ELF6 [Vitis riparia]|uniref:probable lysine-specific demethylase ELF6 n=1 Tax=Vitis riparia TaxID=96939 RepID=UPI00155B381E|nr:probable lysine-specific demethylase ELF6 [Vitis riparia]
MGNVEIPIWLKGLPLAPEFRPTDTEFADPIAYISKIEKEASAFGICKVIPPLPKPSKRYVISNLNKSLSKCPELGSDVNASTVCSSAKMGSGDGDADGEARAVFTTRHQELGQNLKRTKGVVQPQAGVHKQVWQSGEIYTLEQFESKSKAFARNLLGMIKEVSPLVVEAMFWKAASEKPIYVEYANDVPGSGFGEPEGLFQYFHGRRRRRRRTFGRYCRGRADCEKHIADSVRDSHSNENKDAATKNNVSPSLPTSKSCTSLPIMSSDETSRQKNLNGSNEMEGTAGWKLSNSPWNLQVIARSPGSLTRFMPDDIPGVTSPMVYIGMLFSWFAWHVEDHELHSLNFLHTGSPKTWYAVPGDYAFAFEEVIRSQAYGGNIDRLAALTLLGEKTTLLSPEVVVASGIPCCRLIQNPGEFVVTFPRAYHVGFSHGFNCGEAANFGTPQWLKIAKEAAVRRAAMSYLPMLSHQQLLYLLTMSFVSRVPRSLIPGARSSRLKDRQKEERELLVKQAFIEDMLNENNLLSVLLGKGSTYRAVLWDPESLPSSKEPQLSTEITTVSTKPRENISQVENKDDSNQNDLFDKMSLYIENVNDLYLDDDDLLCDFQVDSGTLACVACGILGFPFMSVVQPSDRASMEFLHADHPLVEDRAGDTETMKSYCPSTVHGTSKGPVSGTQVDKDETTKEEISSAILMTENLKCRKDLKLIKDGKESSIDANSLSSEVTESIKLDKCTSLQHPTGASSNTALDQSKLHSAGDLPPVPDLSLPPESLQMTLITNFEKGWNKSTELLRPRIFCLEHAVQIKELLQPKGGASMLIICHSDYQKIKAHATTVAEEIGHPFNYNEIPLDTASQEDLNLINLAIDDEEHVECGEDWTSKLGINLQYCVKIRKNSPSKQVPHALALGGLFTDTTSSSNFLSLKWQSRKSRSKLKSNLPSHIKPCESNQMKEVEVMEGKSVGSTIRKEDKLIQYSRRIFKFKSGGAEGASRARGRPRKNLPKDVSATSCDIVKNISRTSNNSPNIEKEGGESAGLDFYASFGKSEMLHEVQVLEATEDLSKNAVPAQVINPLVTATPVVKSVEARINNQTLEDEACNSVTCDGSEMPLEINITEVTGEKNKILGAENDSTLPIISVPTVEKSGIQMDHQIMEEVNMTNEPGNLTEYNSEGQHGIQGDGDVLMNGVSDCDNFTSSHGPVGEGFDAQIENVVIEESCTNGEIGECMILDNEASEQGILIADGSGDEEHILSNVAMTNQPPPPSTVESSEIPREICPVEDLSNGAEVCSSPDIRELENIDSKVCSSPDNRELEHIDSKVYSSPDNRDLENMDSNKVNPKSTKKAERKRKREGGQKTEDKFNFDSFIRSPCEGLRPRAKKDGSSGADTNKPVVEKPMAKTRKPADTSGPHKDKKENTKGSHRCDLEGCRMSFKTKAELLLHKRNRCPHEGCGKKFSSHKYAMLHQRVHDDERPLKCPWKGCSMSFKWAWARTEHVRVHTGARPYQCKVEGCGLSFRFVSDFSRHRRKTGHYVNNTPK